MIKVIYCKKSSDPPHAWTLLTDDPSQFDKAKAWARSQGYDQFRTRIIDDSAPNFAEAIRKA